MNKLLQKQQQSQKFREMMEDSSNPVKSIEERVDHCKHLQYDLHQQLFAVGYANVHKASAENSISGIKYFLSLKGKQRIDLNTLDNHGKSALHHAAERESLDAIAFLIEQGVDANIRTDYSNTPLMLACKENKAKACKVLLELGADFALNNRTGYNCFHFAAEADQAEAITAVGEFITQLAGGEEPSSSGKGQSQSASVKFSSQADDDERSEGSDNGQSDEGIDFNNADDNEDLFHNPRALLAATVSHASNSAQTPLHIACQHAAVRASRALIRFGAKLNEQDKYGETPLHKAGRRGSHETFQLLTLHGAQDHIQNTFHQTAHDLLVDNVKF